MFQTGTGKKSSNDDYLEVLFVGFFLGLEPVPVVVDPEHLHHGRHLGPVFPAQLQLFQGLQILVRFPAANLFKLGLDLGDSLSVKPSTRKKNFKIVL